MSATSAGSAAGRMRASDADRDATLAQLSEHFQAGRLTQDEFEERSGQALTARTMGELGDLMTDLPCPAVSGPCLARHGSTQRRLIKTRPAGRVLIRQRARRPCRGSARRSFPSLWSWQFWAAWSRSGPTITGGPSGG